MSQSNLKAKVTMARAGVMMGTSRLLRDSLTPGFHNKGPSGVQKALGDASGSERTRQH